MPRVICLVSGGRFSNVFEQWIVCFPVLPVCSRWIIFTEILLLQAIHLVWCAIGSPQWGSLRAQLVFRPFGISVVYPPPDTSWIPIFPFRFPSQVGYLDTHATELFTICRRRWVFLLVGVGESAAGSSFGDFRHLYFFGNLALFYLLWHVWRRWSDSCMSMGIVVFFSVVPLSLSVGGPYWSLLSMEAFQRSNLATPIFVSPWKCDAWLVQMRLFLYWVSLWGSRGSFPDAYFPT